MHKVSNGTHSPNTFTLTYAAQRKRSTHETRRFHGFVFCTGNMRAMVVGIVKKNIIMKTLPHPPDCATSRGAAISAIDFTPPTPTSRGMCVVVAASVCRRPRHPHEHLLGCTTRDMIVYIAVGIGRVTFPLQQTGNTHKKLGLCAHFCAHPLLQLIVFFCQQRTTESVSTA